MIATATQCRFQIRIGTKPRHRKLINKKKAAREDGLIFFSCFFLRIAKQSLSRLREAVAAARVLRSSLSKSRTANADEPCSIDWQLGEKLSSFDFVAEHALL
jgi:hypothetical protein